jgi:PAS domain S-box-containing protein
MEGVTQLSTAHLRLLAQSGRRLAESLEPSATLAAVAELIVPALADWCIVDLIAEDGTVERAAVAHADPCKADVADGLRRYPPDLARPDGGADAMRTGRSELQSVVTDQDLVRIARDADHLELIRAMGTVSHLRVPLVARGRVLGSLLLIAAESGRHYGIEDMALAEELAVRCALALDNARLHAAEERARQRAAALADATGALSEAASAADEVLAVVARLAAMMVGDLAVVRLLSADGRWLEVAALDHPDPSARAEAEAALADERHPSDAGANGAALRTGQPCRVAGGALADLQREGGRRLWPPLPGVPTAALLAVPVRADGRVIGTLSISRPRDDHPYSVEDERFLQDVADRAGLAIERARIFETERRMLQRAAFLSEASAILAADLDYEARLTALSRLAVPTLADWCVIDLLGEDDVLHRLAAVHANPTLQPAADELLQRYPTLTLDSGHTITRVLKTGVAWIDSAVDESRFVAEARDPEHLELVRRLGIASEMVVPLIARGRSLGTITLAFAPGGRRHTPEDLALAQDLAGRAALALDIARLHAATLASEERFRALFEGTADASVVVDAGGRLVEVNEAAVAMTGYTPDELRAMTVFDLLTDRASMEAELARLVRDGFLRAELEIRRKDGTSVPIEAQTTAVELPNGRIYIAAMRDIGERRALERLQQELLATVTHDLKNPLAGISGHAQILQRRQAYTERSVLAILSETRRLGRLIDDLLDVTRAETGQLTLTRDWGDLLEVVQAAVEAAQGVSRAHRVELTAPEGPLIAFFDRDRLEQVVQNLLLNAIKYSPDGGAVCVQVDEGDDEVRIAVADEGIGIPPEALTHLFRRFYRTAPARERGLPGLGLGLFVTRSLIEAHGGRIWAESEGVGQGSRFTVVVPRRVDQYRAETRLRGTSDRATPPAEKPLTEVTAT